MPTCNGACQWEIDPNRLLMKDKIGSGAFSNVFEAYLEGDAPVNRIRKGVRFANELYANCRVAVKMLPDYADQDMKNDFVQEIKVCVLAMMMAQTC